MRIELDHVSKHFGAVAALRDVTCSIAQGERVGLVGPNGSGKSTLLRAIMGLVSCEGSVRLDGRSPFENRTAVAARLAYVPQFAPQWSAPVGDVVRAVTELRAFDPERLTALASRLELDVDAMHSRRFRDLSGGTKQKLLIALALAPRPTLLVLDEPTASLDARARARFFDVLDEEAPGATRLFCSHRGDDLVRLVDRVVALHEGSVAFDGAVGAFDENEVSGVRPAASLDGHAEVRHG
jgi:ABC-type multidrug transport system ATPase subunit